MIFSKTLRVAAGFTAFWAIAPLSPAIAQSDQQLVVVELFTSQSCYSCPPAEHFLARLIEQDDGILGLEFHVDYWDDLNYGAAGVWRDVFSDPVFTERQRDYNVQVRSRRSIFTPQMVIAGRYEEVGSRETAVHTALRTAAREVDYDAAVTIAPGAEGYVVSIDGLTETAVPVWLVRYDLEHETRVLRGENNGQVLVNRNVVREMTSIAQWSGGHLELILTDVHLADNQGCAILVQSADAGPILGAAACPDAG